MPNDYAAAAYPDTWQVLGIQLRPFSLGHYLKLRRLGCAFVEEDSAIAGLGDLLLGVLVCGMTSHPDPDQDEFWQWWRQPINRWQRWFPKLLGTLTPAEKFLLRWGRRCRGVDLEARAKQFNEYIRNNIVEPDYWRERESGRASGAHWSHAVIATLVSKCGYTQLEAYNVPLAKALADFFKWLEGEGAITLMTDEESEAAHGA